MDFNLRAQSFRLTLILLPFVLAGLFTEHVYSQQQVFIDFDSRTGQGDHVYTPDERDQILDLMVNDYSRFNFSFFETEPVAGDFSTIFINDGDEFGLAQQIDPRNLDKNDTATVSVNTGASNSAEFVTLTANVASHELGHLLGLRHFDSFGPIGSGLDPNTAASSDFRPAYNGPSSADDTQFHLMESDSVFIEADVDQFFSERSAIKLTFNEQGTVVSEDDSIKNTIADAQFIELDSMIVPNTIEVGDRAGLGDFDVDAIAVIGTLGLDGGLTDFYQFSAAEGDLLNIELMSQSLRNNLNSFDTTLRLLDSNGSELDYFGSPAFNDDELETFDSILIDFLLPSDGDYFVQVDSFDGDEAGSYELFATRFNGVIAVPEPGTKVCMFTAGLTLISLRRRKVA